MPDSISREHESKYTYPKANMGVLVIQITVPKNRFEVVMS